MVILGVPVGHVVVFDEIQPKIVKSVPSGVTGMEMTKKSKKMREIVFFETLEVFKCLSRHLMGLIKRR